MTLLNPGIHDINGTADYMQFRSTDRCNPYSGERCLELPTTFPGDLQRLLKREPPAEATIRHRDADRTCALRAWHTYHSNDALQRGLGRVGLPDPQNQLEAFTAISWAREQGVTAFWVYRPSDGAASPHWPWKQIGGLGHVDDGKLRGCALIHTDINTLYMSATIVPCDTRLADGVVCFTTR